MAATSRLVRASPHLDLAMHFLSSFSPPDFLLGAEQSAIKRPTTPEDALGPSLTPFGSGMQLGTTVGY